MLQAVILDIDGTLILSNDAHAQAWIEAFDKFGYKINFEEIRPLIGMGGDHIIPKLAPGLNSEEGTGKEISEERKKLVINKYGPNLKPADGARELVLKMRDEKLRLIIATSAKEDELSVLLKSAKVDDLLDEATTSSDASSSKPSPDIVQAALDKLNMKPEEVVMIGDTPYDIQSAKGAGIDVIALRCGGFDDNQLSDAIAIYDHPADLLSHFDSSPIVANRSLTK